MRFGWLVTGMLFLGAALLPGALRADETVEAPNFELTNLEGQEVKLSELRGSVVVLDFFATWCGPCRKALPHTQKLSQSDAAEKGDLVVLAVNVAEERDHVATFVKDNKYTMTVLMDEQSNVTRQYKVRGIPTFVVIDRAGKIRYYGHHNADQIDAAVEAALKDKPAE